MITWRVSVRATYRLEAVCAELCLLASSYAHGAEHRHTEMALISGSSLSPRLVTPVRLPASKHKLAHGLVNSIVAQRSRSSETTQDSSRSCLWYLYCESACAKNVLAGASAIERTKHTAAEKKAVRREKEPVWAAHRWSCWRRLLVMSGLSTRESRGLVVTRGPTGALDVQLF